MDAYAVLAAAIREEDDQTIVTYEPVTVTEPDIVDGIMPSSIESIQITQRPRTRTACDPDDLCPVCQWGMIFDTRKVLPSLGSGFSHVPGGN